MDDRQILERITALVDEEHQLRTRLQGGKGVEGSPDEGERLRRLEESLDQCWDLLRRRRAAREFGSDPDRVTTQKKSQVEGYLQ